MIADGVEWAVHRLLHRYAAAVDGRDPDAITACFGSDGVMTVRGRDYSGATLTQYYRDHLVVPTLHFVTGISVTPRPEGLVGSTCGLFAIEMHDDGWRGITGRYDDVIRVDGDAATFVHRSITLGDRVRLSPAP